MKKLPLLIVLCALCTGNCMISMEPEEQGTKKARTGSNGQPPPQLPPKVEIPSLKNLSITELAKQLVIADYPTAKQLANMILKTLPSELTQQIILNALAIEFVLAPLPSQQWPEATALLYMNNIFNPKRELAIKEFKGNDALLRKLLWTQENLDEKLHKVIDVYLLTLAEIRDQYDIDKDRTEIDLLQDIIVDYFHRTEYRSQVISGEFPDISDKNLLYLLYVDVNKDKKSILENPHSVSTRTTRALKEVFETHLWSKSNLNSILFISVAGANPFTLTNLPGGGIELRFAHINTISSLVGFEELIPNPKNIISINITGSLLTSLPYTIGNFTNLQELYLTDSRLATLPSQIGNLIRLVHLDLSDNQLTTLPPEIGKLINLQTLDLAGNPLTTLPAAIGNLTNLQTLDLSLNEWTALPSQIGNLIGLVHLNLSDNQLTTLPPEIGKLINLQTLDLSYNNLTSLPPEVGNLTNLQILNLADNRLTTLPSEIGSITRLEELNLSNNQLAALTSEIGNLVNLQGLFLNNNALTDSAFGDEILKALASLTRLEELELYDNQISPEKQKEIQRALPHVNIEF